MSKFVKVATTDEMATQPVKCVEVDGKKIALFKVEDTLYAVSDTCTHRGGPLAEWEVEGTEVTCPWHGAKFDLRTGAVLGPPAQRGVKSYAVKLTGRAEKSRSRFDVAVPPPGPHPRRPLVSEWRRWRRRSERHERRAMKGPRVPPATSLQPEAARRLASMSTARSGRLGSVEHPV